MIKDFEALPASGAEGDASIRELQSLGDLFEFYRQSLLQCMKLSNRVCRARVNALAAAVVGGRRWRLLAVEKLVDAFPLL